MPKENENKSEEAPRILKEREIVHLFMGAGIYQHIAQDILKNCSEILTLNEKEGEQYKVVLREAMSILEKEGVPQILLEDPKDKDPNSISTTTRPQIALCKICYDSAAIRATFPDKMRKYFRIERKFRGELTKGDWLCKGCYGAWYRDNQEFLKEQSSTTEPTPVDDNDKDTDKDQKGPRREYYMKLIAYPLFLMTRNLAPKAINHRKMLIRYITLNQIHINQLATALHYLRKLGSRIIEQEDFEKACGIDEYNFLFFYSSWNSKHTQTDILQLNEQERKRKKEEKRLRREQEEMEYQKQKEDEKHEQQRQKQLQDQLDKAEQEAIEAAKIEKWKKILEARKKEDEEEKETRAKIDANKEKIQDKREAEKKIKKKERERQLKDIETISKKKEEELKLKQEERHRQYRAEMGKATLERRNLTKETQYKVDVK